MIRPVLILAVATLALTGCSGKDKAADSAAPSAAPDAKAGGKEAKVAPNPWAKNPPSGPAQPAPAPNPQTTTAKADAKGKKPATNPWAKAPPSGSNSAAG